MPQEDLNKLKIDPSDKKVSRQDGKRNPG